MEHLYKWFLILSSAAMFILCDSLSANWGKTRNATSIIIMFALAPLAYLIFAELNKKESLSISSGLVNMMIIIGAILIGVFYFKDVITVKQGLGLFLAVLAVILMA